MKKIVIFLLLFILFTCNLDELTKPQNPTEEKGGEQNPVNPVNPTTPVSPSSKEKIIFSDNFRIVYVASDSIPSLIYNANARLGHNGVVDDGLTYSLSGDDASFFNIDLQTGVIKSNNQVDPDQVYRFLITASAGSSLKTVDFKLVYLNQSSSFRTFSDSRYIDDSIDSSQAIYAVDLFHSSDLEISYKLTGADKNFFRIDNQGNLYITDNANLRNNDIHKVSIDVSKEDNNSTQKITRIALEVQKGKMIKGLPASDIKTFAENTALSTQIYDVNAKIDKGVADTGISYSLTPSSSPFQIDSNTGKLTLKSALDYETTSRYDLTLTASSQAQTSLSASFTLTIKVSNVQEINGLPTSEVKTFAENTALSTQIYDVNAKIDKGVADTGISYSLAPSSSPFQIDSNTGKLTLKSALDYETTSRYDLTLTATSQAQASSNKSFTLTIKVSNVQEINGLPVSDAKTFAENTALSTEIYDINAKIDKGVADTGISYSLAPSSSPFQIDSNTGKLTLKSTLDYETTSRYDLTLTATSQAQASLSASFTLTIKVSNVQEINGLPVSDAKTFAENTALSTEIYDVNAKIDKGVADTGISYSLAPSSSPFQIDSNTGKLTLKSALDYETTSRYDLTLTATSQAQASSNKSFTLTIKVSNVQEINGLPVSDAKTFAENTALNTEIYDINAKIDKGVADTGISYSLAPSSSPFQIDSNTGKLTLKSTLDYETKTSYNLTLTATSQAQTSSNKSFTLTIKVSNVQEINGLPTSEVKTFAENTALNTEIYDINAKIDKGVADTGISYSLAPSSSPFQIDSNTGKLTLKSALDYETTSRYDLTLTASSQAQASSNKSFTLTIKVSNVQEINGLPVSDAKTFAENTALSTEIYDVNAKIDKGVADTGISYSLAPSSSPFQIDSNTGKLTLKSALDYETTSRYDLTLTASSQAQASSNKSFTLTIKVSNVQEINGLPVSDAKTFAENTALSTQIYDINAKIDKGVADTGISYSLAPSSSPFQIDSNTGKLTLKSALDYETTTRYDLTLTASSQAQTSSNKSFTLTIKVSNVQEINGLPTSEVKTFAENTALNTEIYDINAKIDKGVADTGISYSLAPSSSPFQIDSNTGKLTLKSALDYETTSSYNLTLIATSQAQASSNKSFTLTIKVSNVQEINGLPVSDAKTFAENTALNTEIYDINAKIDKGVADTGISYSLAPSSSPFQIDSNTGKLTLKSALDYETTSSYDLTLTATSQAQASSNKSFTLTIKVSNVQEINGLPTSEVKTFAENTALNTEIYDINAKIDKGVADTGISYSLAPSSSPFQIDSDTGKLTLKSALDYETTSSYNLTLTASSQAQTNSNKSFTLTIKVSNIQEINGLPVSDAKTFAENTALSTEIYDINAKIDKGVADTGISYSLAPSSSPFQIDSNTGRLTLKSALDYETASRYDLTLTASSQAQTSSNKSFTLTIKVSNVQEINGLPVSDAKTFAENTALNTEIYDINAKIDKGVTDTGISYSLAPSSSPFQIDSNTGKLTLKSALDYETTSSYDLTLTASSQAQASSNKSFTLTIKVSNVQEINGLPTSEVKTFAENTALNTEIYDVNAKIDKGVADTGISYSLAPSSSPFQIDSNTGKLTLKSALDYETTSRYDLTLTATSQAQASSNKSFTLTIKVSNVQEINGLPTSEVKTFAENTALNTEIYDINAKIDKGVADTGISYSLAPSSSPFQIDSDTGKLTLKSALDYETTSKYDLTLTATSQAQTSSNKSFTLTIKVSNVQEINGLPVSDAKTFAENTALNTEIYDINAKIDKGVADTGISYSLAPSSSPFQIDSDTGKLTLKSALDYETTSRYDLTLTASSQAQTSSNKSFTLTIKVSNVQEINGLPVSDAKTFAENTALSTQIYDINAKIDKGVADTGISYSLAPSSSPFQIDSNTGKLTLKSTLDYETKTSYNLTLTASSQAQASSNKSFTLTIKVSNVQEINGLPTSNISKTLRENFTVGGEIYDVNAKIDSAAADTGISYSLSPSGTPFQIDSSTGKLTLTQSLTAKAGENYSLNIGVTNNAALQATLAINIRIILPKDFYLWLVKPDGTKLDTALATTPVRAGYKYEAEVANPEIRANTTFSFHWQLISSKSSAPSRSIYRKTFSSSNGKSYYIPPQKYEDYYLSVQITYGNESKWLFSYAALQEAPSSQDLGISWINKTRNNISLDASAATIEVADELSYNLSDWLAYTGLSSVKTEWRVVPENRDRYNNVPQKAAIVLDKRYYKDSTVQLGIKPYADETWVFLLKSKVKITNTDEGVIGGKLSRDSRDLTVAGTTLSAGERAVFSDLVDLDGLQNVLFNYTWYLLNEKEPASLPRPTYSVSSWSRSVYLNIIPADAGKYLMLKVSYTDLSGFENEYTIKSAEAVIAASNIEQSQGQVVFDRRFQFPKIPLVIKTNQAGKRYVWRILESNSQRPLSLVSDEGKVISLNATYADDYGFQTNEEQIILQFQGTGAYYVTLEVFSSNSDSQNFISEQLNIQGIFTRGG